MTVVTDNNMFLFTLINNRWLQKLWPSTSYVSRVRPKPVHGAAVAVWMMQLHVCFSRHTGRIMQNSTVEQLVQIMLPHTLKMVNMSKLDQRNTKWHILLYFKLCNLMYVQAITIKYCKSYVPRTNTMVHLLMVSSCCTTVLISMCPWEVFKRSAYSPHLLSHEFHVFGLYQRALKRLFISLGWQYGGGCHTVI